VSKLRRPFLSGFFIAVLLLRRREVLTEPDFAMLARAFNRVRALHPFYLTAWVFLSDHCHNIPLRGLRDLWEVDGFIFGGCYSHGALQNRVE
jgi:hypothetical protein